jgi:hypothetical protein
MPRDCCAGIASPQSSSYCKGSSESTSADVRRRPAYKLSGGQVLDGTPSPSLILCTREAGKPPALLCPYQERWMRCTKWCCADQLVGDTYDEPQTSPRHSRLPRLQTIHRLRRNTHPRNGRGWHASASDEGRSRIASFFEDEIAGWQRQRANRGRAPPHLGPIYVSHQKVRAGTTGHGDAPVYRCSRRGVVTGMAKVMENEKRAFSIAAFCENYGIGRTSAYEEIAAGRLQVVKAGKRTLVPADAAESWLRNLPPARVKEARQ